MLNIRVYTIRIKPLRTTYFMGCGVIFQYINLPLKGSNQLVRMLPEDGLFFFLKFDIKYISGMFYTIGVLSRFGRSHNIFTGSDKCHWDNQRRISYKKKPPYHAKTPIIVSETSVLISCDILSNFPFGTQKQLCYACFVKWQGNCGAI